MYMTRDFLRGLELDKETVMNTGKQKVIDKYKLEKEKYIVYISQDGGEGLYKALADIYDLIILDVSWALTARANVVGSIPPAKDSPPAKNVPGLL